MKYLVIIFAIFMVSCSNSQEYSNSKVSMVDKTQFNYPFKITNVKSTKNANGFLEVQIEGFNTNKHYNTLEYRVEWLDKKGFKIYSIQDNKWFKFDVFRNQSFTFNPTAYNLKAEDFRIFIRDPKNNTYNAYNSTNTQGDI